MADLLTQRREELAKYLGSDAAVEWLLRITAAYESEFRDLVNKDSGAAGYFQFLKSTRENLKAAYPVLPTYLGGSFSDQAQYAIVLYSDILRYFRRKGVLPAFLVRYNALHPTYPLRVRTRLLQYGYHAGLNNEPPIRTSKHDGKKTDTAPEVMKTLKKVDAWWLFATKQGPAPSLAIANKHMQRDTMSGDITTEGTLVC